MIEEDSPILDFYPSDFDIDMNGKKMAWQGVALLPFIDQGRLLTALESKVSELSEDEKRRNKWGDTVMFVADDNDLTPTFSRTLYGVKAAEKQVPLDAKLSHGVSGSVLADPRCMPHSRLETPLPSIEECPDLESNNSLSVRYFFPQQKPKHRSVILKGYRAGPAKLSGSDKNRIRFGGGNAFGGPGDNNRGRKRGGGNIGGGPGRANHSGPPSRDRPNAHSGQPSYPSAPPRNPYGEQGSYGGGGGGSYGGGGYGGAQPPRNPYGAPAPSAAYGGGGYGGAGGYGGSGGGYGGGGGGYGGGSQPPPNAYGAPPPSYGRPPPGYGAGGYGGGGGGNGGGRGGYNGNAYGAGGGGRGQQPRRY
jgi:5'-3' exoribonuclease 2